MTPRALATAPPATPMAAKESLANSVQPCLDQGNNEYILDPAFGSTPTALIEGQRYFLNDDPSHDICGENTRGRARYPLVETSFLEMQFLDRNAGGVDELAGGVSACRTSFQSFKRCDDRTFVHRFERGTLIGILSGKLEPFLGRANGTGAHACEARARWRPAS